MDRRVILPQDLQVKSGCPSKAMNAEPGRANRKRALPKPFPTGTAGGGAQWDAGPPEPMKPGVSVIIGKDFFFIMEKSTLLFKALILTKKQKSTLICKAI